MTDLFSSFQAARESAKKTSVKWVRREQPTGARPDCLRAGVPNPYYEATFRKVFFLEQVCTLTETPN